jgi:hypothetical protein
MPNGRFTGKVAFVTGAAVARTLGSIGIPSSTVYTWYGREDGKLRPRRSPTWPLRSRRRHMRFQRFLKLLRGARDGSTAGLAMEAGYADQAHLGRESRRLRSRRRSGSQLCSRAARRNSGIAPARAPGHA